jgi:hypothetical protein
MTKNNGHLVKINMIVAAEIINQPHSGEFEERIFDNESCWNSQEWTWIKFTTHDFNEWCGEFRGFPRNIAVSKKMRKTLILTSDYLYCIDCETEKVLEIESQPQYQDVKVAPTGEFILCDYYSIFKIESSLKDIVAIESQLQMDMIKFQNWDRHKLNFSCDEFLNWDRHLEMQLDTNNWLIHEK